MEISKLYQLYLKYPQITTDSRVCPEDSLFIALKGEKFNGNKFALSALQKGCTRAIIDEPEYQIPGDSRYILVDNCLKTYQQLAREHRLGFSIPVIGITGTNGKTTTKELVSAVLGQKYNVLHTDGNFNNDVGVPKTLFRLTKEHQIAVIEMGASHPGDIKTLVEIVEPDYGIITNVGKAHLQGFGSFEGVIRTKGELYDYLRTKQSSKVFINADNPYLMNISHGLSLIKYGTKSGGELLVKGEVTNCSPFLNFRWCNMQTGHWNEVRTHLVGAYNIDNMLAAACIGLQFEVPEAQICQALAEYAPSNNRSQLTVTADNKLIVDAYNANPTSMHAAIENFKAMHVSPKIAILGDMRELGNASKEEHQRITDELKNAHFDEVWLIGEAFCNTKSDFRKFHNIEEVKIALQTNKPKGCYILIKGSNGLHLSQLPELL